MEACRSQLESTRQLLLQREDNARMGQSKRKQKLMDILQSAQDKKDRLEGNSIELARLLTVNENFKRKLDELEAARDETVKTDIEARLDELRWETDFLGTLLSEAGRGKKKAEFEAGRLRDTTSTIQAEMESAIAAREEVSMCIVASFQLWD